MDKQNANKQTFSLADIEQYLQGKLTPAEMHAMERAAIQDPFLADAMEGYADTDLELAKKIVNQVNAGLFNINNTTRKQLKRNRKIWLVAASFILLAGSAAIGLLIIQKRDDPKQIVQATRLNSQQPIANPKTDTLASANTSNQKAATPNAGSRNLTVTHQKTTGKIKTPEKTIARGIIPDQLATAMIKKEALQRVQFLKDSIAAQASNDLAFSNNTVVANHALSALNNQNSQPDTLYMRSENKDNIKNDTIRLSSGIPKLIMPLVTNQSGANTGINRPALTMTTLADTAQSLDEIVIIGNGNTGKKASKPSMIQNEKENITPENGWPYLQQYLTKKLGRHLNNGSKQMQVIAEISILKGKVKDVTILESFNPSINHKLIRLLQKGPGWTGSKNDTSLTKHQVTIRF